MDQTYKNPNTPLINSSDLKGQNNRKNNPDLKGQNNHKSKPKSTPKNKKPLDILNPNKDTKFKLTPLYKVMQIKEEVITEILLLMTNAKFSMNQMLQKHQPILQTSTDETKLPLINILYFGEKFVLLKSIEQLNKMINKYIDNCKLYTLRAHLLDLLDGHFKEFISPNIKSQINKYLGMCVDPLYSAKDLLERLEVVESDMIKHLAENAEEIKVNPKYEKFLTFDSVFTEYHSKLMTGFKKTYLLYKQILTLLLQTIIMTNNELYVKVQGMLSYHITNICTRAIPYQICDHHYFFELLRLYVLGPFNDKEKYPLPDFTEAQKVQFTSYMAEILDIYLINLCYTIITSEPMPEKTLWTCMPITQSINKKPDMFFGKELSNNTFGLLLAYLSAVNYSLLQHTIKSMESQKQV